VAEREYFDFSQREVGAFIVKKWGFPETLESLIRSFDDPEALSKEKYLSNLGNAITLADRMCQKFGMGWRKPGGDEVSYGNLPESLGITGGKLDELAEKVKLSLAQSEDFH